MTHFRKILTALMMAAAFLAAGCASTPQQASLGENIDDAVITSKIKALYVEDKAVSALDITVETFKGTVQLSGFANDSREIARAAEIARSVKGVVAVKNDVLLKSAAAKS